MSIYDVMNVCKKCGFEFTGKYCPECGTLNIDLPDVANSKLSEVTLSSFDKKNEDIDNIYSQKCGTPIGEDGFVDEDVGDVVLSAAPQFDQQIDQIDAKEITLTNSRKKLVAIILPVVIVVCVLVALLLVFLTDNDSDDYMYLVYGYGEEGIYYYDSSDSVRYMLYLQSGAYTLSADGKLLYSGDYDYDTESHNIYFSDGETGFIAMFDECSSIDFVDLGYYFIVYTFFDIVYMDESGNIIATISVLNGQTAPALSSDKEGFNFFGWYVDAEYSTMFSFDTSITADTIIYGRFLEKSTQLYEYEITLDYGNGSFMTLTTEGGVVWNLPANSGNKDILGWWVSATNKSDELTYMYTNGEVLTSDTTLFAVYEGIGASVTRTGVTWINADTDVYITVYNSDDTVAIAQSSASYTSEIYVPDGFSSLSTGTYKVEVISGTTKETLIYVVNGLSRVSMSSAEITSDGEGLIFSFVPVDYAEGYILTVTNGVDTLEIDLGDSTSYDFSEVEMTADGITFTVYAYANDFVDSVSSKYTYLVV